MLAAVVRAEPDWSALPPSTPPNIRMLLERCLQKEASRRLRDIGDARLELEASPPSAAPAPLARASTLRWPWLAAAALAGVLVAGFALWGWMRRQAPEVRQIRFTVPVQETARILSAVVAVSPDGRRLAYTSADSSGRKMLWVRPLDSTLARALPGTEGAMSPFWSPDSKWIAFFARGKLRKVEAAAEAQPEVLCDASDAALGGAWSTDGTIVFAPAARGGLFRVSAAGGVPAALTTLQSALSPQAHAVPQLLPDGRHFLYFVWSPDPALRGLFAGSLDGKVNKRLTGSMASYARTPDGRGYLLSPSGTALRAQRFDESRLEPAGDPQTVAAEPVQTPFSVSDSGVLAYRAAAASRDAELVWFDRAGKRLSVLGEKGDYMLPRFSLDGKRLAVERHLGQGGGDIYLFDVGRDTPARLTFDAANHNAFVAWSPDGSRMVFHSTRQGNQLLLKAVGAANEEPLVSPQQAGYPTDWSRDGRFVVYEVSDPKTQYDIWLLPMTGERKPAPLMQTKFNEMQGQFSPDGRWIAYASDETGQLEVYVRPFPSGGGQWRVSANGGDSPRWRRDGKELFYLAPDGRLMAVPVSTGSRFEAGAPRALFQAPFLVTLGVIRSALHWDVTADGQRFLLVTPEVQAASTPITVVVNWYAGLNP